MSNAKTARDIFIRYFSIIGFTFCVVTFLFLNGGYTISDSTGTSILTTLITAQASLLAIIFSLTFVGIQLIAPRYSPRLNWVFTEDPTIDLIYIWTGVSLIFDLIGISIISEIPAFHTSMLTIVGIMLAAGFFLWILIYTRIGFRKTTPDGIIETIGNRVDKQFYMAKVEQMSEDDFDRFHPLRGLYELIINAYSESDPPTAKAGLECYCDIGKSVFTDLVTSETTDGHLVRRFLRSANNQLNNETYGDEETQSNSETTQSEPIDQNQRESQESREFESLDDSLSEKNGNAIKPVFCDQLPYLVIAEQKHQNDGESLLSLGFLSDINEMSMEKGNRDLFQASQEGYHSCVRSILNDSSTHAFSDLTWEIKTHRNVLEQCFFDGLTFAQKGYDHNSIPFDGTLLTEWVDVHELYCNKVGSVSVPILDQLLRIPVQLHQHATNKIGSIPVSDLRRLGTDSKIGDFSDKESLDEVATALRVGCFVSSFALANGNQNVANILRNFWVDICKQATNKDQKYGLLTTMAYVQVGVYSVNDLGQSSEVWADSLIDIHNSKPVIGLKVIKMVSRMISGGSSASGNPRRSPHIKHEKLTPLSSSNAEYQASLKELRDSYEDRIEWERV